MKGKEFNETSNGPVGTVCAIPEPLSVSARRQELSVTGRIHFDIFTLFPAMFAGPFAESILKRAQEKNLLSVLTHDIRAYTTDRHHVCDDTPYGGGGGMIMKPEPIVRAVETVLFHEGGWHLSADEPLPEWPLPKERMADNQVLYSDPVENRGFVSPVEASENSGFQIDHSTAPNESVPIILLTPQGRPLTQQIVGELSCFPRLALICGRYEGVDERVRSQLVTDEISIGDYVLSGGELAAMVLVDSITRLIPGVLGYEFSAHRDSHSPGMLGLLEGPQYTRPHTFRTEAVPDALLSGHHAQMAQWHREQSLLRTLQRRPELLAKAALTEKDKEFLRQKGWISAESKHSE